ncbi:MAG: hypothetical protein HZB29_06480 [Nitrospinae bacterium]|nr:hypothetical protein [Nitrospinota bacterium]
MFNQGSKIILKTLLQGLLLFSIAILSTGCATSNMFRSYTEYVNNMVGTLPENGAKEKVLGELDKYRKDKDKILYLMERGRIAQLVGETDISIQDYNDAIAAIQDSESKAVISASKTGASAGSILTNDNAIPYSGYGFEKIFLHHFQAENYLIKGKLEDAGVEARLANERQKEELARHEKELEKVKADEVENKKSNPLLEQYSQQMRQSMTAEGKKAGNGSAVDELAGKVKNSFQNAYSFYLSGLIYEQGKCPKLS